MTTSRSSGTHGPSTADCLTNSRMSRFNRFRVTALPVLFVTVIPHPASAFSHQDQKILGVELLATGLDRDKVAALAQPAFARETQARRPAGHRLLLGDGDAQALASLGPAAPQHRAASSRLHAGAEAVRALPALVVRLISSLHDGPLRVSGTPIDIRRPSRCQDAVVTRGCTIVIESRKPASHAGWPCRDGARPLRKRPCAAS